MSDQNIEFTITAKDKDASGTFTKVADSARSMGTSVAEVGNASSQSGQQVSNLRKFIDELAPSTNNAHASFTDLHGTLRELWENPTEGAKGLAEALAKDLGPELGAIGVAAGLTGAALLGVGVAVYEFAEQAAHVGGEINDMSEKMSLSAERTSKLKYAMDIAGGSIDQASNLIFKLQARMADSPDEVEKGLGRIGLSIRDLESLKPDEQLYDISKAFQANTDQSNRAATAMELFSKSGRDAIPLLMKDLSGLSEEAEHLGYVWSEEDTKAAEEFEMSTRKLHKEWSEFTTNIGKMFIPALASLAEAMTHVTATKPGGTFLDPADQKNADLFKTTLTTMSAQAKDSGLALTGLTFNIHDQAAAIGDAASKNSLYLSEIEKLRQAIGSVTESQAGQIQTLHGLGDGEKQIATILGISEQTIKHYLDAQRLLTEEQRRAAAEAGRNQQLWEDYNSVGRSVVDTIDQMDGATVEAIKYDLQRGVSVETVTKVYGVHKEQIQAIQNEEKFLASVVDTTTKSFSGMALVIPNLSDRTATFREELDGLFSTLNQVSGGISIAGDQLDHVLIPAYGALMNVASSGQVHAALTEADGDAQKLQLSLDGIASAFSHIGVSSSSGLGQAISGFEQLFRVIEQAEQKYQQVADKFPANSPQVASAASARNTQMTYAAIGVGTGYIAQTIDTGAGASTGSLVAHGALEGASVGASIAPYAGPYAPLVVGAAAGVGAIAGWIESGQEWRKVVNDISRDMGGIKVSEDFAKMIDKLEDDTGLQRTQAITTQLDQLMQMAGGLNAEFAAGPNNFDLFFSKLHDAFSYIEQGSMSVASVTQIMDKNFDQFVASGTDGAGRVSDKIKELIDLNRRFGTDSKEVAAWQLSQAVNVMSGVNAVVAAQPVSNYDATKSSVDTARAAAAPAASVYTAAIAQMGEAERAALQTGMVGFKGTAEEFLAQQHELYRYAQEGDDKLKTWLSGATETLLNKTVGTADVFQSVIDEMSKAERDSLLAGMGDYKGTASEFLAQQAALYQTAQEGDERLKTWLSADTLKLIAASPKGQALVDALAEQQRAGEAHKAELSDVGTSLVGGYAVEVSTGKSPADALKDESAALTQLQQEYTDLGLEVTDVALQNLFMQNSMQTAAPALMAGIAGVAKEMIGLDNLNLETADSFLAQEHTAESAYTRVQDVVHGLGGTTKDALLPMQDYLHQALIEAQKLNTPLDALTQQMIDQSKDAGVWQDNITPTPTLLDAMHDLNDVVKDIDRALRGLPPLPTPPSSPSTGSDASTSATEDHGPIWDPNDGSVTGLWTGGVVRAAAGWDGWGSPSGSDTVRAWLTPGERVLSVPDTQAFDAMGGLGALRGGVPGIFDPDAWGSPSLSDVTPEPVFSGSAGGAAPPVTNAPVFHLTFGNIVVAGNGNARPADIADQIKQTMKDAVVPELFKQWQQWQRNYGVEITVEELEDGRHRSRLARALKGPLGLPTTTWTK